MEIQVLLFAAHLDDPFIKFPNVIGDSMLVPAIDESPELLQECVHHLLAGHPVNRELVQYVLPHDIKNLLQMLVVCKAVVFVVECKEFNNFLAVPSRTVANFELTNLGAPAVELRVFCTIEKIKFNRNTLWLGWFMFLAKIGPELLGFPSSELNSHFSCGRYMGDFPSIRVGRCW